MEEKTDFCSVRTARWTAALLQWSNKQEVKTISYWISPWNIWEQNCNSILFARNVNLIVLYCTKFSAWRKALESPFTFSSSPFCLWIKPPSKFGSQKLFCDMLQKESSFGTNILTSEPPPLLVSPTHTHTENPPLHHIMTWTCEARHDNRTTQPDQPWISGSIIRV